MTEKVHGNTRLAADLALERGAMSKESHAAVLRGELGLQEAKDLGRNRAPDGSPAVKAISKGDRSRECMCGCGNRTRGRFAQGHDQRLVAFAKEHVKGERELTDEQMEYVERSGKLERARQRVTEEDRKRREKAAAKAKRQRVKEGAAEAKKQSD